jgi:hypothetical protein
LTLPGQNEVTDGNFGKRQSQSSRRRHEAHARADDAGERAERAAVRAAEIRDGADGGGWRSREAAQLAGARVERAHTRAYEAHDRAAQMHPEFAARADERIIVEAEIRVAANT